MIEVANATLNSNMLPHGPRPTTNARRSSDTTRSVKPRAVRRMAARPSGVGEPARSGPAAVVAVRVDANDPPTTPAHAGCRLGTTIDSARRPFASITAWPTWAANPSATKMLAIGKRICEIVAAIGSPISSGCGGAAGWRPIPGDDHRSRFDLEDEPAVSARPNRGRLDDVAFRAANGQLRAVAVAAGRSRRVHEAVVRAIRLAGREDRSAEVVRRGR